MSRRLERELVLQRIEDVDAAIAAHAVAAGATLITANTGHMVRVPCLRVDDWAVKGC